MKPITLGSQQRQEIERRRKKTLDSRIYQRLTAVLTIAGGTSRGEVAHLLGIGLSQLGEWLRVYRNKALDALCTLHYKGDPGKLTPRQGTATTSNEIRGAGPRDSTLLIAATAT